MGAPLPAVQFKGLLIDRSGGQAGLRATSSRELMEKAPAWTAYIQSITGWSRVEHGTLTLDNVTPLPLPALNGVAGLGAEPQGFFDEFSTDYGGLMRFRGTRWFYGAIARAGELEHVAAVSQQENPAKQDRLEVYSSARLRDALGIKSGDWVYVDVYHKDDWIALAAP